MKFNPREKFSLTITIAFFVSGVFLTVLPAYKFGKVIHSITMWETTKGVVTEFVDDPLSDEGMSFVRFSFGDASGKQHVAQTATTVGTEYREIGEEVRVFYDPEEPTRAHPGFLLVSYCVMMVFFPFGLLLMYLGWPFHSKKE